MRNWETWVRSYLDLPPMADGRDQRIVAELAVHLEQVWQEARARGANEDEADALVHARMGDRQASVRELLRSERNHAAAEAARRVERVEHQWRTKGSLGSAAADVVGDLRQTARVLLTRPLFMAVVVFVLALGIGATTAIFTLVDAVVLSPLPFPHTERLVTLAHSSAALGEGDVGSCAAWHVTYREENRAFEDLCLYSSEGLVTITGKGDPEASPYMETTSSLFGVLGLQPTLGRNLADHDDRPNAPLVAMLGHGYWRSRFGGDPAVVGQVLQVDGRPTEIVGVAPPGLASLGFDPAIIVPLRYERASLFVGNVGFDAIARLKPGVSLEQAAADITRMLPMAFEKFPGGPVIASARQAGYAPIVRTLEEALLGRLSRLLWVVMAGVTLLLLIACANVANLFLVRADGKQKEMALRCAVGASRGRMVWEYLRESLLLAALGGGAGLGVAHLLLRGLVALAPPELDRVRGTTLDSSAFVFAAAITVFAGVLFGCMPFFRHMRRDVVGVLKQGGHSGSVGRRRSRTQQMLVVGQVALVTVLLVASGLLIRSAQRLRAVEPGFGGADTTLVFRVNVNWRLVQDLGQVILMQEAIAHQLETVRGVDAVGMATAVPAHPGSVINPVYVQGVTAPGKAIPLTRRHKWTGGGYFETLGIPVLAGRSLTWQDAHERRPVVVVSRSLALAYWGSVERALGGRMAVRPDPPRWYEVVGVVGDVHEDGAGVDPVPLIYWPQVTRAFWEGSPAEQLECWRTMSYAVRGPRVGTAGFLDDVKRAVWAVNPDLPLRNVGVLSSFMTERTARLSFVLVLLTVAAGIGLVLGLVGIYGVMSYSVSQQTLEFGVRLALGAQGRQVTSMVVLRGAVLVAAGVTVGLGLGLLTTRVLKGLLFGVTPADPATFAVVAVSLVLVGLVASCLPAQRASRVDVVRVLKAE